MELILRQDVQNLGFKDDIVSVKMDTVVTFNPQFAHLATSSAKKVAENLKQRAHK
jgi:large subunit ribosomal protein L9